MPPSGAPEGPGQLIAAITDDFGIPIQHYVQLNFDGFQGVVQALGGLKMYFPMPVYDADSSLYVPDTRLHDPQRVRGPGRRAGPPSPVPAGRRRRPTPLRLALRPAERPEPDPT